MADTDDYAAPTHTSRTSGLARARAMRGAGVRIPAEVDGLMDEQDRWEEIWQQARAEMLEKKKEIAR